MATFLSTVRLAFEDVSFSSGIKSAKANLAGMEEALNGMGDDGGMTQLAANIAMATNLTEPFRAKLSAALDAPSQKAAGLESAMAAVNSVLNESNSIGGDVEATYGEIQQAALQWAGGVTSGSKAATAAADEFSQATYGMISAGLDAPAAIEATGQALILAKATMGDAKDAGNLLGVMYNNLGSELSDLSDIVAATQGAFQIANLGQLSEGLKYGIPVAKQYRIETAQLATTIGALNSAGLQGSMAGTAFGAMMNNMSKAAADLDFDLAFNSDGGIDVISTLQNIQDKLGPLDSLSVEASDKLKTAFGAEGVRAVTLLGSDLDKLQEQYKGVANTGGIALDMAAKQSDTFADSMARMTNAASVWQIKFGQGANLVKQSGAEAAAGILSFTAPLLETNVGAFFAQAIGGAGVFAQVGLGAVSTGLQMSSQFALLASAASNAGGYMALLKNATGLLTSPLKIVAGGAVSTGKAVFGLGTKTAKILAPSLKMVAGGAVTAGKAVFGMGVQAVGFLGTSLKMVGGSLLSAGKAIFGMGVQAVMAVPKLYAMAAANWAAIGPVLAIVAAIGAVIAVGVLLYKHWDVVWAKAVALWDGLVGIVSTGVDWIIGLLNNKLVQGALVVVAPFIGIPLAIAKNWDSIRAFFADLWQGIKDIFGSGVSWIKNKVADIPVIGKLFSGEDSGPATVDTLSAGMTAALPAAERAGFEVASAVDQYMPHSDAKKGPLSRLTESGGALIDTLRQGANKKKLDLSGALGFSAGRGNSEGSGGTTIHIENLTVQANDADDLLSFVRMLKVAGGAA